MPHETISRPDKILIIVKLVAGIGLIVLLIIILLKLIDAVAESADSDRSTPVSSIVDNHAGPAVEPTTTTVDDSVQTAVEPTTTTVDDAIAKDLSEPYDCPIGVSFTASKEVNGQAETVFHEKTDC